MIDDALQHYLARTADIPRLSDDAAADLVKKMKSGNASQRDSARQALALAAQRLIIAIVLRTFRQWGTLDSLDLIQEGNVALMLMLCHNKLEAPFFWCLGRAVKWRIIRAAEKYSRTIRLSEQALRQLRDLARIERQWMLDNDMEPTIAQLAAASGISEKRLRDLRSKVEPAVSIDVDEIRDAILSNAFHSSVSPPPLPDDELSLAELRQRLEGLLAELSEMERTILAARYGLSADGIQSTADLARRYKLTQAAVRNMEDRALQRLRHPERLSRLREFAEN